MKGVRFMAFVFVFCAVMDVISGHKENLSFNVGMGTICYIAVEIIKAINKKGELK